MVVGAGGARRRCRILRFTCVRCRCASWINRRLPARRRTGHSWYFFRSLGRLRSCTAPVGGAKAKQLFTGLSTPRTRLGIITRNWLLSPPLNALISRMQGKETPADIHEYRFPTAVSRQPQGATRLATERLPLARLSPRAGVPNVDGTLYCETRNRANNCDKVRIGQAAFHQGSRVASW